VRVVLWSNDEASLLALGEDESPVFGHLESVSGHAREVATPITANCDLPGMSLAVGDSPSRHKAGAYGITFLPPRETPN
jgi:hypothetical protein